MENSFNVKRITLAVGATVLLVIIIMAGYVIVQPDFTHYQAAPISGQVVDKETGEPVEGVHVAVYWQLYDSSFLGGLGGRYPTDVIGVSETVTDEKGYYHIPGWEKDVSNENYLGEESPMIGFYKTGYEFKRLYNSNMALLVNKDYISEGYEYSKKETEKGDIYISNWDGVVIELNKDKYDVDEIIKNLRRADWFVERVLRSKDCKYILIKNFIISYSKEAKEFRNLLKEKYPKKYRHALFSDFSGINYNCKAKGSASK